MQKGIIEKKYSTVHRYNETVIAIELHILLNFFIAHNIQLICLWSNSKNLLIIK